MSIRTACRNLLLALLLTLVSAASGTAQAAVDPELSRALAAAADGRVAVIVTFHGTRPPAAADLEVLRLAGIAGGVTMRSLPMAGVLATRAQVDALSHNPRVRSVFWNKQLQYFNYDARHLTGVERLRADAAATRLNGGLPVSGRGIGVVINDSGVDGTHPDLQFGRNLVQNVLAPLGREDLETVGFNAALYLENQPNSDLGSGHGTHVAGTVGGSGQASSGKHAGVAPGAKLIGFGSGAAIFVLNAIGGFDWALTNQAQYDIRVITNSWGSSGGFNPDHPVNVASRIASEQRNMVVTFAAGNEGSAPDTHNPYAKAPWVISVAAGEKNATLAGFSSRGTEGGDRTVTSRTGETIVWRDEPTITAPGVDIHSAFTATGPLGLLEPDLTNPFYTIMSGTSMATPVVAGIVALMLEANPLLTPAEVKRILQETATRMPGYKPFEVGAGYANAYAAVQKAFQLNTPFGAPLRVTGVPATVDRRVIHENTFNYSPVSLPGAYKHTFAMAPGASLLEVKIEFDGLQVPLYGNAGNPLLLDVFDPAGNRYLANDLFFALYGTRRLVVVVNNPMPGNWTAEVKALTPLGNNIGNTLTFPDRIHETITATFVTAPPVNDIQGHAAQGAIEMALVNGFLGLCSSTNFCPNRNVRRSELARAFTQFGAVRQFLPLGGGSTFTDVSAADRPFVEAVAARGAAMRDREFRFGGVIEGNGSSFNPNGTVTRAEIARMLVRGIGGDVAALAHTGDVTVQHNGRSYVLADQDQIPAALRGYVHVAINSNMLNVFWTVQQGPLDLQPTLVASFEPGTAMTRADAAVAIQRYFAQFFGS
jgi:serine protease AprX